MEILELIKKAEAGDADAMFELACAILPKDYDAALDWYRKAADAGNVDALVDLMRHYEADEFYEAAADMAERIVKVADAYRTGNGVAQDLEKAVDLYEKVAAQDYEIGNSRLEELSQEELVTLALAADKRKDFRTAFQYYRQAAELGSVFAMNEVGSMYLNGTGVEKSVRKSFRWLKKAAELKNPVSMAMVARMYELGIGVDADINEALKWYVDAANAGEVHAKQRLEMLFNEGR